MLTVFNHKKPTYATVLEATYQKTQLQRQLRDTSFLFQHAIGRMAISKCSWESQGTTVHTSTTDLIFFQVTLLLISFSIKCVSFFFNSTKIAVRRMWCWSTAPKQVVQRQWLWPLAMSSTFPSELCLAMVLSQRQAQFLWDVRSVPWAALLHIGP